MPTSDPPEESHSIHDIPQELLDSIIHYLDGQSMLRFCRAVPVLNHIADTLYGAGQSLGSYYVSDAWPHVHITSVQKWHQQQRQVLEAYFLLLARYNGSVSVAPLQYKEVPAIGSLLCTNLSITISIVALYDLQTWASQKKQIDTIKFHIPFAHRDHTSAHEIESYKKALIALNPIRIEGMLSDGLSESLKQCRRLQSLQFTSTFHKDSNVPKMLPDLVVGIPSLKTLSFYSSSYEIRMGLIRVLANTGITHISFAFFGKMRDDEISLLRSIGFVNESTDLKWSWRRVHYNTENK